MCLKIFACFPIMFALMFDFGRRPTFLREGFISLPVPSNVSVAGNLSFGVLNARAASERKMFDEI